MAIAIVDGDGSDGVKDAVAEVVVVVMVEFDEFGTDVTAGMIDDRERGASTAAVVAGRSEAGNDDRFGWVVEDAGRQTGRTQVVVRLVWSM